MFLDYKVPANIRTAFVAKVEDVSKRLGIKPEWLMLVMNSESGLDSKAVNYQKLKGDSTDAYTRAAYRATGLIQFMPSTSSGSLLKTTNQQLYMMTPVQQLDYVYKYYSPFKGKLNSFYDLYLAAFFPIAAGKPDNWVLESPKNPRAAVAKQNPAIAKYSDKPTEYIDVKAFKKYTDAKVAQFKDFLPNVGEQKKKLIIPIVLLSLLAIGTGIYYFKYYKN